jgi:hypothetical protein
LFLRPSKFTVSFKYTRNGARSWRAFSNHSKAAS